ncbi:glycosyltransferase family 2 protein [Vibrio sp. 1159]|uniref:glycosyltransferase family 2 protein n=1 Tax=Vibrio sp. 1159 TaxID=3074545 RepID=UPI0029650C19|nr:glycosyltransferase family 2 protein [Vibrio sp. 1159]MDW2323632.1 glycosyltransferase family 2 protein [Vibrio sp. 1159]
MKNEADYILEWVAWNIMVGFDKVVIYTNHNDDNSLEILSKLQEKGYIDFFELDPPETAKPQMYAFKKSLEWLHTNKPNWVACFDADEYLVLKEDRNIEEYLSRFDNDIDAIAFNWKIYGSGGIVNKGTGLTIERFLMRAKDNYPIHSQFKSLFRYKPSIQRFHHRVFYKNTDFKYVYSDGKEFSESAKKPGFRAEDSYINYDLAQLNHYTTRSVKEFLHKMDRGNGFDLTHVSNKRHKKYLDLFDKNDIYESDILGKLDDYLSVYYRIKKECEL